MIKSSQDWQLTTAQTEPGFCHLSQSRGGTQEAKKCVWKGGVVAKGLGGRKKTGWEVGLPRGEAGEIEKVQRGRS